MENKFLVMVFLGLILATSCQRNIEQGVPSSSKKAITTSNQATIKDTLIAAMGVTDVKLVATNQYAITTNVFGRKNLVLNILSTSSTQTVSKIQNLAEDSIFVFTFGSGRSIVVSAYKDASSFVASNPAYTRNLLSDNDKNGLTALESSDNSSYYGVLVGFLNDNDNTYTPPPSGNPTARKACSYGAPTQDDVYNCNKEAAQRACAPGTVAYGNCTIVAKIDGTFSGCQEFGCKDSDGVVTW